MRTPKALVLAVLAASFFTLAQTARATDLSSAQARTIRVGALFSLTGNQSASGIASVEALDLASQDIHDQWASLGLRLWVDVDVEDTGMKPEEALVKLKRLASRGIRVVIGPETSAELAASRDFADSKGILVVSTASTASSLAVRGDNVFRFCAGEALEGDATAALMWADGIRTLVPIWRNDVGMRGLASATGASMAKLGAAVAAGVSYEPATTDFAPFVAELSRKVREAGARPGAGPVGVYFCSFDEAGSVLSLAAADTDLSKVRWYGSDGITQSPVLLADAKAAAVAESAGFPAPAPGLDDAAKDIWGPLSERIASRTGSVPDAYSLGAYDALWVSVLATLQAEERRGDRILARALTANANRYWGATGATTLDAAGDRKVGNFDFFAIRLKDGARKWVRVARYVNGMLLRD